MTPAEMEAALDECGWVALDLPEPSPVFAIRGQLLGWLRDNGLPDLASLEEYHVLVPEDQRHVELLHGLATYYWEADLGRSVIATNLDLFRRLVAADLHIQRYPYLRAVRPGKNKDAAPMHRDTYYGASPYEVSIVVPFTEMDADGAIRVVSGSHLAPDSEYPFVNQISEDVVIRSPKHQLGFPYAPRVLDPEVTLHGRPVPLRVGQALVFPLSLVHGGGINNSGRTRFSTDIRIANSLAPVSWSRGVHADYFVPLCSTAVSRSARQYLDANATGVELT